MEEDERTYNHIFCEDKRAGIQNCFMERPIDPRDGICFGCASACGKYTKDEASRRRDEPKAACRRRSPKDRNSPIEKFMEEIKREVHAARNSRMDQEHAVFAYGKTLHAVRKNKAGGPYYVRGKINDLYKTVRGDKAYEGDKTYHRGKLGVTSGHASPCDRKTSGPGRPYDSRDYNGNSQSFAERCCGYSEDVGYLGPDYYGM